MAVFVAGQIVASAVPSVSVDNALKPGSYRFQLVVVDDSGNASAPAMLGVTVRDPSPPPPPPPPGPVRIDPNIFRLQPIKVLNPTTPPIIPKIIR
jgi:hypothetical protein